MSSATPLWFTEGGAGLAASYPGQDWFNMVQAELLGILTAGNIKPEKGKLNQLTEAIKNIVGSAKYLPEGYSYSKIESDEKYQPKGKYQPAGTYVTPTELNDGLKNKLNIGQFGWGGIAPDFTIASNDKFNELIKAKGTVTQVFRNNLPDSTIHWAYSTIAYFKSGDTYTALTANYQGKGVNIYAGNADYFYTYKLWTDRNFNPNNYIPTSNITQSIGTSTTQVISQKAVADAMLGVFQAWKNLTNERSLGIAYTNTTGKPITVIASFLSTSSDSGLNVLLTLDDISIEHFGGGLNVSNSYKGVSTSIIIPAGSKYRFDIKYAGGSIKTWAELR